MTDNIDVLLRDLSYIDSGWHRHENPVTGAVVLFPETAKNEAEWERRALDMHEAQETIRLEAKPEANTLVARKRQITRGD